jgi:AAA family ATP:ADP antiporter
MTSIFVGYFLVFALVLFPNHTPDLSYSNVQSKYFEFKYLYLAIKNWPLSVFYVLATLWSIIIIALMFWQLANHVSTIEEAKRQYIVIHILGNSGLIVGGVVTSCIVAIQNYLPFGESVNRFQLLTIFIGLVGILLMIIHWNFHKHVLLKDIRYKAKFDRTDNDQQKISMIDGLKYVFSSKYLGLIALLVICYGVSVSVIEGVWKQQVQRLFPNRESYSDFMGQFQIYMGIATISGSILGITIVQRFSWLFSTILTPIIFTITGVSFFSFILFSKIFDDALNALGITSIAAAVIVGTIHSIASRASKHSIFEATKEMAYIPLDDELKTSGKAAVDVIGNRFGKSGGAVIQWLLLTLIPGSNLSSLAWIFFIIYLIVMVVWSLSIISLNTAFLEKVKKYYKKQEII